MPKACACISAPQARWSFAKAAALALFASALKTLSTSRPASKASPTLARSSLTFAPAPFMRAVVLGHAAVHIGQRTMALVQQMPRHRAADRLVVEADAGEAIVM